VLLIFKFRYFSIGSRGRRWVGATCAPGFASNPSRVPSYSIQSLYHPVGSVPYTKDEVKRDESAAPLAKTDLAADPGPAANTRKSDEQDNGIAHTELHERGIRAALV
jgi:hypothetical protein